MSDEKCGLCGTTENIEQVWSAWSCQNCYTFFLKANDGKHHLATIIYKLISRIEKLETTIEKFKVQHSARLIQEISAAKMFEIINFKDYRERLEKLEQENKDLNESYQGLAAENRFFLENHQNFMNSILKPAETVDDIKKYLSKKLEQKELQP